MPVSIKHRQPEMNTSSVADIAFLLLSFFLMTTVIQQEKGLMLNLPPWRDQPIEQPVHERNLLRIHINSNDELLLEGQERIGVADIRSRVSDFVLNNGLNSHSSESPEKAIVSLRADRGASHRAFVSVLDEIQAFYHELYASRAGMSVNTYLSLDPANPKDKDIIERAKAGIPMNISLADKSN